MSPTPAALRIQIDHVQAACMGIEDAIANAERLQSAGKRTDTLNPVRQLRLKGFRDVIATLEWLLAAVERKAAA